MTGTNDGWVMLAQHMARAQADPIYTGFMRVVTNFRTRRTVQVATRKYRARRRRR